MSFLNHKTHAANNKCRLEMHIPFAAFTDNWLGKRRGEQTKRLAVNVKRVGKTEKQAGPAVKGTVIPVYARDLHMGKRLRVAVRGKGSPMSMTTMMVVMMTAMAWRMRFPFPVCGPRLEKRTLLYDPLSWVHLLLSVVSIYNLVGLPLGTFLVFVYPFCVFKFSHLNATTSWPLNWHWPTGSAPPTWLSGKSYSAAFPAAKCCISSGSLDTGQSFRAKVIWMIKWGNFGH